MVDHFAADLSGRGLSFSPFSNSILVLPSTAFAGIFSIAFVGQCKSMLSCDGLCSQSCSFPVAVTNTGLKPNFTGEINAGCDAGVADMPCSPAPFIH